MTNMYKNAKTWNPFKGCEYQCTYCRPSFQAQAKRQLRICKACYDYAPHEHPERLSVASIPRAPIVFICGVGDISFSSPEYTRRILDVVREHSEWHPNTTYYLQSKRPEYFEKFLPVLPPAVVLVTTIETNRDAGYHEVAKAPVPSVRAAQFRALDWERKVVTAEPLLAFDLDPYVDMMESIRPDYVWVGMNSKPNRVRLTEPHIDDVARLLMELDRRGIERRSKDLRGL